MARLELRRRDLLARVGALLAASCGRGRTPPPGMEGGIVGGAHRRGHLLREGFRPRPDAFETVGVAILGAGMAGLSAAWALERAGYSDFVVVELEDAAGGTARSGRGPVSPYPWGAHYVPAPPAGNRPLVALLTEVGAVTGRDAAGAPAFAEEVLCREPQERVFFRGEWYEGLYPLVGAGANDVAQLRAFEQEMRRQGGARDASGRPAFSVPRALAGDGAELRALDGVSMADYMAAHGWDSPRLRWFVDYACRDDFGSRLEWTSAWAGVHYYASRLYEGREESAELLTWPEGNGRLVAHLAGVAGPRLRTGALVTDVTPTAHGVEVVYHDEREGRAHGLRARSAIFALPRFLAARLVAPWRADPPAFLAETVYGSWMVANLTLRDRPRGRGFGLAWDNVLYDSASLGYVSATHQAGVDHGPTVLTYYLPILDQDPRQGRARLLGTTWEQWAAAILADLRPAHPDLRELVQRMDVYLWGHAMVRPRPRFMWSDALARSAHPLGPIHFAHTDLSGMALCEEAQYWGIHAAEAVLKEQGRRFQSWLAA